MALPVLIAVAASVANVVAILREFRKTAAFVISAVIWSAFLWLFAIIGSRIDSMVADLNSMHISGASSQFLTLVSWLDKLEYMFPVYTAFKVLGLYISMRVSALLLHYLFKVWDAVPFKGSAGS